MYLGPCGLCLRSTCCPGLWLTGKLAWQVQRQPLATCLSQLNGVRSSLQPAFSTSPQPQSYPANLLAQTLLFSLVALAFFGLGCLVYFPTTIKSFSLFIILFQPFAETPGGDSIWRTFLFLTPFFYSLCLKIQMEAFPLNRCTV